MSVIASVQPLVIAAMLGWAGAYKLAGRTVGVAASRSALPKLLGTDQRALVAYRVTGGVELLVAVALLVAGDTPVPAAAASVVGAGFLAYLGYARLAAPKSSCGCTSARSEPIGWRSFARAGIVAAGSLLALFAATTPWWAAGPSAVVVVVLEAALVLALSPDFDRTWLMPVRAWWSRHRPHPLGDIPDTVPVTATALNLERSEEFGRLSHVVRSGLIESWDTEGWRIMTYGGRIGARAVTVVFAVGLDSTTVGVRSSIVDERTGETVAAPPPPNPTPVTLPLVAPA
ncbi:MauE/DoxX family redox-associated membrane protein [Fodinicola acaciae]|uniref:MauE/DoxX family redox-associated membrane protein n=1 Tax=Fodinicola acaciae TaxID=2681555 RepID=UPI001C9E26CC|nr:MauE/DoxX family redox-associated membrane protein [Fodinicola acaciae]